MFDEFGTANIGHENRSHEGFVDFLHQVDGVLALRANYDPIRAH
jgi:hypothetical protein